MQDILDNAFVLPHFRPAPELSDLESFLVDPPWEAGYMRWNPELARKLHEGLERRC